MGMSKLEIFLLLTLYISTLWLWSLPFQKNPMPYGEVDATSHFSVADYMFTRDKPINKLPPYIDFRYGQDNKYNPHHLWYYPPYNFNLAIFQIMSNNRFLGFYLGLVLLSSIIVLGSYFVVRSLYGFIPAFLSSLLLSFSYRDYIVYLWGQWPEKLALFYLPIILFCCYKYLRSRILKEIPTRSNVVYLYLVFVLLAFSFYFHPQFAIHIILALVVFSFALMIKHKSFLFDIKHLAFAFILFIVLLSIFPYQTGNVILRLTQETPGNEVHKSLFSWVPYRAPATNPTYFEYSTTIGSWTWPFLVVGLIFLLYRRKDKDLMLLAWLVSLYLMLHFFTPAGRIHRALSGTAHIFFPIIGVGFWVVADFFSGLFKYKNLKYFLLVAIVFLAISTNGILAYNNLNKAYEGIIRLNDDQHQASIWLMDNIPMDAGILLQGILSYPRDVWQGTPMILKKFYWFRTLAQKPGAPSSDWFDEANATYSHVVFDYSDLIRVNNQQGIALLRQKEENMTKGKIPLYNKGDIRVYKID